MGLDSLPVLRYQPDETPNHPSVYPKCLCYTPSATVFALSETRTRMLLTTCSRCNHVRQSHTFTSMRKQNHTPTGIRMDTPAGLRQRSIPPSGSYARSSLGLSSQPHSEAPTRGVANQPGSRHPSSSTRKRTAPTDLPARFRHFKEAWLPTFQSRR